MPSKILAVQASCGCEILFARKLVAKLKAWVIPSAHMRHAGALPWIRSGLAFGQDGLSVPAKFDPTQLYLGHLITRPEKRKQKEFKSYKYDMFKDFSIIIADSKSAKYAFDGSNPSPTTTLFLQGE